jgi:hypothetical protein
MTAFYPNPIRCLFDREKRLAVAIQMTVVNTQHQVCTNADINACPRKFESIEPKRRRRIYRYAPSKILRIASASVF